MRNSTQSPAAYIKKPGPKAESKANSKAESQPDSKAKSGDEFKLSRASQLSTVQALQGQLTIKEQGRQSGVIQVSLQHKDPVLAARILNEVGSLYVRQNIDRKAPCRRSTAFQAAPNRSVSSGPVRLNTLW